jgi:hypothetical protein
LGRNGYIIVHEARDNLRDLCNVGLNRETAEGAFAYRKQKSPSKYTLVI